MRVAILTFLIPCLILPTAPAVDQPQADKKVGQAERSASAVPVPPVRKNLPTPTPDLESDREANALAFVRENHAELATVLEALKPMNPAEYRKAIVELSQVSRNLADIKVRNPRRHDLVLDGWKAKSRVELLAAQLAGSPGRGAPEPAPAWRSRPRSRPRSVASGSNWSRPRLAARKAREIARPPREEPRSGRRGELPFAPPRETRQGPQAVRHDQDQPPSPACRPSRPDHPSPTTPTGRTDDDPTPQLVRRRPGLGDRPRSSRRERSDPAGPRPVRGRRRPGGPRLPAPRPPLDGPGGLQHPVVPRLVPGPGRVPALAVRLRLQGRPRHADEGRRPGGSTWPTPGPPRSSTKPTLAMPHKGGKRFEADGWQYRLLERWIEGGAKGVDQESHFDRLEVTPAEIRFIARGEGPPQGGRPLGRRRRRGRHLPDPVPDQ